jgi:hypothetical protein
LTQAHRKHLILQLVGQQGKKMSSFKTSLDNMARYVIPGFCVVICVLVPAFMHSRGNGPRTIGDMVPWFTIAPLAVLMVFMYLLKPSEILLGNNSLTIVRLLKPITIALPEIVSARLLDESEVKGTLRTFGNGGLFGYFGKFYNRQLGHMSWYCTQRKNYVLIALANDKKIVLSPDEPTAFLAALKALEPGERVKVKH